MRRSLLLACCLFFLAPAVSSAEDEFAAKVRPILARYCFKCHGPDDKARKAKLRLDDRDAAVKAGAIVPSKPADSELIKRVFADEDDQRMPPPGTKLTMTKDEKETLKRWIAG